MFPSLLGQTKGPTKTNVPPVSTLKIPCRKKREYLRLERHAIEGMGLMNTEIFYFIYCTRNDQTSEICLKKLILLQKIPNDIIF